MCFEKESFDPARGAPPKKPAILSGSDKNVLESIWDASRGIFGQIATIELEKYEAERLLDIREAEEQAKIARQKTLAGTILETAGSQTTQMNAAYIGLGMIGVAGLLLLKKG